MSDDNTASGTVDVEIDREDNFKALWANAYAEFGPANTTLDLLLSLDAKIVGSLALSTSGLGVQIDTCVAALGVEVDAGNTFALHGLHLVNSTAEVSALCNKADADMATATTALVNTTTEVDKLKSTVSYLESGGAYLCGIAMMAKL